jgi:hypothetical protein
MLYSRELNDYFLLEELVSSRSKSGRTVSRSKRATGGKKADKQARWAWIATIAAAVIGAGGSVAAAELTTSGGGSEASPTQGVPTASQPPEPTHVPYIPGVTYAETVNSSTGARVFANPQDFGGEWTRIPNGRTVQVSCKLYAPSAPGLSYWYLVASAPWDDKYYSSSSSFLNGDTPGRSLTHDTDFHVPDCPSP